MKNSKKTINKDENLSKEWANGFYSGIGFSVVLIILNSIIFYLTVVSK